MEEIWETIPDFPKYLVSNLGNIKSLHSGEERLLKPHKDRGYLTICLSVGSEEFMKKVHRLVALAFIGPIPDGMEVRHLDGNGNNNRVDNLSYGTKHENMSDSVQHGTHFHARKTECKAGHPFNEENTAVYKSDSGGRRRQCRTCVRERSRVRRLKFQQK